MLAHVANIFIYSLFTADPSFTSFTIIAGMRDQTIVITGGGGGYRRGHGQGARQARCASGCLGCRREGGKECGGHDRGGRQGVSIAGRWAEPHSEIPPKKRTQFFLCVLVSH